MDNIKLTIAYDGTGYLGWQKTSMGPSIEETLQGILEKILQEKIVLQASSRTDAGVHAQGQIVNFFTHKETLDLQRFVISLNQLLPKDIAILHAERMAENFHPTLDVTKKCYHYTICMGHAQLPQHRFYSWHYPHALNVEAMRKGAAYFIGEHDFSSFCNFKKNSRYQHYVRTLYRVEVIPFEEERLRIEIEGDHFLYKMARNIAGTLAYIGNGKLDPTNVPMILQGHDRTKAGMTAPAHGLTLYSIHYCCI